MFEPDEFLVKRFFNYLKKRKQSSELSKSNIVYLIELKNKLSIVARAITGQAIEIFEAEREGGYKNTNFFLPAKFSGFTSYEENIQFYIFRTLFLCEQFLLNLNYHSTEPHSLETSRNDAKNNANAILERLFNEYPNTQVIYAKLIALFKDMAKNNTEVDYSYIYGKWMMNSPENTSPENLEQINHKLKSAINEEIKSIKKANAVEEIQSLTIDKKQQEDAVLQHNFEKVETAEEWDGGWRDFDGDDDLDEHENALEEINMRHTVRVDDPVHSVYQSDFIENTTIAESAEINYNSPHVYYDEWDYKMHTYKKDYCKVFPSYEKNTNIPYYNTTIQNNKRTLGALRKTLASINNRYQEQKKQVQGNDFDLDSIIDLYVDLHSQKTPTENIYLSKKKIEKELSILLLLDISLSSDSFAANHRILDIEKQVAILFGEILSEFNVDFEIDGFYSKTRNFCFYHSYKKFDEPWIQVKFKIAAAQAQGYTRIGTALRHAGALIAKRPTKNKWVILLSDGKPNDYDRYEGKYGINDVKQAIRELNQTHINAYSIAIEAEPKYYLPQMFGPNHYKTITNPTEMVHALTHLYEKTKYH